MVQRCSKNRFQPVLLLYTRDDAIVGDCRPENNSDLVGLPGTKPTRLPPVTPGESHYDSFPQPPTFSLGSQPVSASPMVHDQGHKSMLWGSQHQPYQPRQTQGPFATPGLQPFRPPAAGPTPNFQTLPSSFIQPRHPAPIQTPLSYAPFPSHGNQIYPGSQYASQYASHPASPYVPQVPAQQVLPPHMQYRNTQTSTPSTFISQPPQTYPTQYSR